MADVNPKEMVAAGYDQIALQGDRGLSGVRAEERRRYTALLLQSLSTGSEVLELGCGAGRVSGQGTCTSTSALSNFALAVGLASERLKSRAAWPLPAGSPGSATGP